ncbi:MAG: universal stress protein [SAR324 cluster bacterium]
MSQQHFARILDPVRAELGNVHMSATFGVVAGHPAEQIVRYAEMHGSDPIGVGRRGHTLFERWLIGSVARRVIAYASRDVTVMRR